MVMGVVEMVPKVLVYSRLRVEESLRVAIGLTGVRRCALITVLGDMNGRPLIITIRIINRIVTINKISKVNRNNSIVNSRNIAIVSTYVNISLIVNS
jgi:hypothetical protein